MMKRCFVAMAVAEATRNELALLQRSLSDLPRSAARRLRPVKPANMHVTIKFLGDTPDEQIPEVIAALAEVSARARVPGAVVEGTGAFPSPARPRVVFAALGSGRDAVTTLCVGVEDALAPLGITPAGREPTPHVTLARVEAAKPHGPLTRWLEETPPRCFGPVSDHALILFESQLTPAGAVYHLLAELPLGVG